MDRGYTVYRPTYAYATQRATRAQTRSLHLNLKRLPIQTEAGAVLCYSYSRTKKIERENITVLTWAGGGDTARGEIESE